jgi:hypothetical protein
MGTKGLLHMVAQLAKDGYVMVSFIYHLDWVMWHPESWLNMSVSVSMKWFLDEIDI